MLQIRWFEVNVFFRLVLKKEILKKASAAESFEKYLDLQGFDWDQREIIPYSLYLTDRSYLLVTLS